MAEMLRDAGYATAIFGKWHLGDQPYSQPQQKGFDEFYGIPPGVYLERCSLWFPKAGSGRGWGAKQNRGTTS